MAQVKTNLFSNPTFTRVLPFALFMSFIAIDEGLRYLVSRQFLSLEPSFFHWLYLPKAVLTGLILLLLWRIYSEINAGDIRNLRNLMLSVGSGVLVFVLWINMDWTLGSQSAPAGFDPGVFSSDGTKWLMIAVRIFGAVIIVPIMEELFWRSFLLRYLIDSDFTKVEIGRYTIFSFLAVAILFGLEHHYVFAGIMAGVVFNVIYYMTKSIAHCIVSHAVANLCLAGYVLATGHWHFW